MIKRLFLQSFPVQIELRIEFIHVFLRRFFNDDQGFAMLVGFRFYMRGIRIENVPADQLLLDALLQDVVKDSLCDVVVPKAPDSICADCRVVRPFLGQFQSQKPLECDILVHLLRQFRLRLDAIQIAQKQHAEQQLRLDGRSARVRRVQFFAQVMNKAEIHSCIDLSQNMILGHQFIQ